MISILKHLLIKIINFPFHARNGHLVGTFFLCFRPLQTFDSQFAEKATLQMQVFLIETKKFLYIDRESK